MKKSIVAIVLLCAAGMVLVNSGCRSKGSGYVPKTDTVVIENMQFNPSQLSIHSGDTIVWINKGIVTHNVTEDTMKKWTSGDINVGDSWKTVPQKDFNYLCTIHPAMKGSVVIAKD